MSWGNVPGSAPTDGEVAWVRRPTPPGKRLLDQVVVVTGASRGFGKLIALAAADEGADVVVNYVKSQKAAAAVVKEIEAKGRKSLAVAADISKWNQVKSFAEKVWKEFGRCDVLINNAGETAATKGSWRDLTEEMLDETLNVDLKGTMLCTHEFGMRMVDLQQSGNIVNIGSNVIVTGSPRAPEYAAAKYGILGITKSYALAFAPHVRVNFVGPGYMDTESLRQRKDWTPLRKKWVVNHTPSRSIGKPENMVHIVIFLASQDSFHMTGNTMICDGGFSMPGA
jgi:3-oxoacyl-[acyl-carrier protein] reductase